MKKEQKQDWLQRLKDIGIKADKGEADLQKVLSGPLKTEKGCQKIHLK